MRIFLGIIILVVGIITAFIFRRIDFIFPYAIIFASIGGIIAGSGISKAFPNDPQAEARLREERIQELIRSLNKRPF